MNSLTSNRPLTTLRAALLVSFVLFISGCTHLSTTSNLTVEQWAFTGKVAIRNAEQASSFNVDWQQHQDRFNIKLTGPLGQGEVQLYGNTSGATLVQGEEVYRASNLTQLVYETTALDLPLEELMYWVRGSAYPFDEAELIQNETGQTTQIIQTDWTVNISAYFDNEPTQPRKLNFSRDKNSGKLIIRQWYRASLPDNSTSP